MPKRKSRILEEESPLSSPPSSLDDIDDIDIEQISTPRKKVKTGKKKPEPKTNGVTSPAQSLKQTPKKRAVSKKEQAKTGEDEEEEITSAVKSEEQEPTEVKVKRKRKTKEEKEAEKMPLAARTVGHKLYIGAHVSASGGVHNAVVNSVHIGANAFALFLKSQRKWANPALSDEIASSFHEHCKSHSYDATSHVVPHGSYLVNLAHTDSDRTKQAYDAFLDDLQRCERLGIKLYNFHPGNTAESDRPTAIKHLATNLNKAHQATGSVITLLENMAAGGKVIGTTFEDLRDVISYIDQKDRVGVCLDTCHAFAAGYDLRTPAAFKATMEQFDKIVGLKYLKALHLNDSKAPFESHRDLHANIGTGYLGLRAFHNIINEPHFVGLPLVLETPTDVTDEDGEAIKDEKGNVKTSADTWAKEIKLLESLLGMDPESEEFTIMEESLAKKGEKERKRLAEQAQRRLIKEAKQAEKSGKKKKKAAAKDEASSSADDEEVD